MHKPSKKDIGDYGEHLASEFLISKNYIIMERNWRFSKAEIDIICKKNDVLIFVEVKYKSYDFYGKPAESITTKKERLIIDAANRYMEKIKHTWEIRFDIISILKQDERAIKIEHYKDAFY